MPERYSAGSGATSQKGKEMPDKLFELSLKTYTFITDESSQVVEDTICELEDLGNDLSHRDYRESRGTVDITDYRWENDSRFNYKIGSDDLQKVFDIAGTLGHRFSLRGVVYLEGYYELLILVDDDIRFFSYYEPGRSWTIRKVQGCLELKKLLK